MKIIIIGGGVGGLATYHALRKYLPESVVELYEAYPSPASSATVIGGGLGLAPNGQRVIADLSPEAMSYISDRAYTATSFVFRDQNGKLLGEKKWKAGKLSYDQIMTPRAVVHEGLLLGISQEDPNVIWGKRATSVKELATCVEVEFDDGHVKQCDLVIGADGVHSLCRQATFGKDKYIPEYDGLTGIGGFLPFSSLCESMQKGIRKDPVTMTFSRSGFFGYSLVTPVTKTDDDHIIQWWSTFEINPPPDRNAIPQDIKEQLLKRHGSWKSPWDPPKSETPNGLFRQIITEACEGDPTDDSKRWLVLPRYNIERLTTYTSLSGRIILIGDAAHPVPPDSGQGVSAAAEDALALSLLLKHFLKTASLKDIDAIRKTAVAYSELRVPRILNILRFSKQGKDKKKDIGFLGEKMRDLMLWIFCNVMPDSVFGSFFEYKVDVEVEKYLAKQK